MTHQYSKLFLSLFFFTTLLDIVYGGYIPPRKPDDTQQNAIGNLIRVPGLKKLGKYVCNDHADLVKRQVDSGEITVSAYTIKQLLEEIRIIELKLISLLEQAAPPSAISSVAPVVETVVPLPLALPSAVYSAAYSPANTIASAWTTTISVTTTTTEYVMSIIETSQPLISSAINEVVASSLAAIDTPPFSSRILEYPPAVTSAPNPLPPPPFLSSIFALPPALTPIPPDSSPTIIPIPPIGENPATINAISTNLAGTNRKYNFNPGSSTNIAVYYGQSPATSTTTLSSQCADPNIDIVVLAFVTSQLDGGKYPSVNFGSACGGQTTEMVNEAPGLLWCPQLASMIQTCQQTYGKKVFLSVGGSTSRISFTGPDQAKAFGNVLWDVFGPSGNVDPQLRPFGTVQIDGFDIDNEDYLPAHFDTLALTLRTHFSQQSKAYYLSSAPQCPFPDASDPIALLLLCDFVWVQFYNNPRCEIGSAGFGASLQQWSRALAASTLQPKPKLYLGAPAWSAAGPTAYAGIGGPEGMKGLVKGVENMKLGNFGGVMFWDGPEGVVNVEGGKDIIAWAKMGLSG